MQTNPTPTERLLSAEDKSLLAASALFNPARGENETREDYKLRRRAARIRLVSMTCPKSRYAKVFWSDKGTFVNHEKQVLKRARIARKAQRKLDLQVLRSTGVTSPTV